MRKKLLILLLVPSIGLQAADLALRIFLPESTRMHCQFVSADPDILMVRMSPEGRTPPFEIPVNSIRTIALSRSELPPETIPRLVPLFPKLDNGSHFVLLTEILRHFADNPRQQVLLLDALESAIRIPDLLQQAEEAHALALRELNLHEPMERILHELNQRVPPLKATARLCYLNAASAFEKNQLDTAREWILLALVLPRSIEENPFLDLCRDLLKRIENPDPDSEFSRFALNLSHHDQPL